MPRHWKRCECRTSEVSGRAASGASSFTVGLFESGRLRRIDTSSLQYMKQTMDRIDAMQAFVAVADLQGFAPAARKLGLSPSGVTRLIAALEQRLGARLLQRTTRQGTPTDAG